MVKLNGFVLLFSLFLVSLFFFQPIIAKDDAGQEERFGIQDDADKSVTTVVSNLNDIGLNISESDISSIMQNNQLINNLSEETKTKLINIYVDYKRAKEDGNETAIKEIQQNLLQIKEQIMEELKGMNISSSTPQQTKAVCTVSVELRNRLTETMREYEQLASQLKENSSSADIERIQQIKETMNQIQEQIRTEMENCQGSNPTAGQAIGQVAMANNTCVIPVELTQSFEGLMKQYNKAISENNTEEAKVLEEKINEIKSKLAESKGQCVKTVVSARNAEIKDVIDVYKSQIQSLNEINDSQTRNMLREEIRNETKAAISEILQEKRYLNISDLIGIVNRVSISNNKVDIDGEEVNESGIGIELRIRNRTMNLTNTRDQIEMTDGPLKIRLSKNISNVEVTPEQALRIMNKSIAITPTELQEKAKIRIRNMEMVMENNTLVYSGTGEEDRKLLGLFSIKVETKLKANAENGQIISQERPWWAFLTTE